MGTVSKKAVSAVAATVLSSLLLLGGTLAWQSISQRAVNKASGEVNPGGRLHDDFDGVNKDIYVENFADEPIFARVRLLEYLEVGEAAGHNIEQPGAERYDEAGNVSVQVEGEALPITAEVITPGARADDTSGWAVHLFHQPNVTETYYSWTTGGQTAFMPTFNMNKDSTEADVNGTLEGPDGLYPWQAQDAGDAYADNIIYAEGLQDNGLEVKDADLNTVDEIRLDGLSVYDYLYSGELIELGEYVAEKNIELGQDTVTHTAKLTENAVLISVEEWLELYEAELALGSTPQQAIANIGRHWAFDEDGWCYYTAPIPPRSATGLLLSGIQRLTEESCYYAIHVEAQFITAGDIGRENNTGFYGDAALAPSKNALVLLENIGAMQQE